MKSTSPAKKKATKKVTKKVKAVVAEPETAPANIPPITPNRPIPSPYTLTLSLNATECSVQGEGMEMFTRLPVPLKFVTKAIVTLKNNNTGQEFTAVYPPFLTRKLLTNYLVQMVQWKRLSGKVA